jgi:dihydrolipoamide dehydrogenase
MRKNKIDVYMGAGVLTGTNSILVDLNEGGEAELKATNIIVATGARPRSLPGVDFDGERIISYEEAIMSETLPERLVIVGGGVIGVEFAYMWVNYGVDVTIVEMMPRLLPAEEPEVSQILEKAYKKLGVKLHMNMAVEKIDKAGDGVQITLPGGDKLEADQVM